MKTITGIILLLLLFCHILGLSLAVLWMKQEFEVASPSGEKSEMLTLKSYLPAVPYAGAWENSDEFEGLYRIDDQLYNVVRQVHENDTLYVTLQMNASAWERFSELSEMMQNVTSDKKASDPLSTAIKLLNGVLKIYLPLTVAAFEYETGLEERAVRITYANVRYDLISHISQLHSPPPETV